MIETVILAALLAGWLTAVRYGAPKLLPYWFAAHTWEKVAIAFFILIPLLGPLDEAAAALVVVRIHRRLSQH